MTQLLRPALTLFALLSVLTGIVYPFAIAAIARLAFPLEAGGSLLLRNGDAIGSSEIGQNFADPAHFWGRPSATAPQPYNALA
jgi:K+-transporting ATPase ATPase C chain